MNHSASKYGRRPFLRSLGGACIALPFCRSLTAHARPARVLALSQSTDGPNLVAVMTPNGVLKRKWMPEGDGTSFTLGESFAPLAAFRDRMVVFRDVNNSVPAGAAADNHRQSLGLWTGDVRTADLKAKGPSFDTYLGKRLGGPIDVLRLGIQSPGAVGVSAPSYEVDGTPKLGNNSARKVFEQLFGSTAGGAPMADPLRRSVLDDVVEDYRRVSSRVDTLDRGRIEAHLQALREVEVRLQETPRDCSMPGDASAYPGHTGGFDSYSDPALTQALMVAQFDLAALALSCGRTHVVSIMVLQEGEGGSSSNYPWIDPSLANHHTASHAQKDVLALADRYNLERTAQLVKKLDEFGLNDNTLVVQGSGLSNGAAHDFVDLPILMIGKLGGRLKAGRLVRGGQRQYNDVILTVLSAFGFPQSTFGNPAHCKGPFTELLGG